MEIEFSHRKFSGDLLCYFACMIQLSRRIIYEASRVLALAASMNYQEIDICERRVQFKEDINKEYRINNL